MKKILITVSMLAAGTALVAATKRYSDVSELMDSLHFTPEDGGAFRIENGQLKFFVELNVLNTSNHALTINIPRVSVYETSTKTVLANGSLPNPISLQPKASGTAKIDIALELKNIVNTTFTEQMLLNAINTIASTGEFNFKALLGEDPLAGKTLEATIKQGPISAPARTSLKSFFKKQQ